MEALATFNNIFDAIINPTSNAYTAIKILFIATSLYFIATIIYVLSRSHYIQWLYGETFTDLLSKRPYGVRRIDKVWKMIIDKLETGSESDFKLAIIEADSVLDEVLKKVGYKGDNLEARLKQLSPVHYPHLNKMWEAHRARNDIVRDPDYRLRKGEAKQIIDTYRKILEDLEVF